MTDDGSDTLADLADRRGAERAVYQPAEDSRLLAEAAVEHARGRTLEVGTGSGWVAERIATETTATVIASDPNPAACREVRDRGVPAVRADLVAPFRTDSLDTVAFNPPYLPTDPDNEWDDWMERALSGGESGRAVIDPFLDTVGRVLRPDGIVLLLVSSLTGFEAVVDRAERNGFATTTVRQESYPFETLSILRLDFE
ncbi:methyltransferase [Haloplanus rallus]|jgi:release factor glutamine methyltransferase|uniref:Methyltransferase n=1 Tax=Haloplanus rallus TaxID=1816183 RepID=A0A6B9F7Y6_9EURY|nr:HemK2/MTQ2 family protein methyltransferase [Haloplanus rallus]QGX94411.1 methyltransferase [Haloplanus rallus]